MDPEAKIKILQMLDTHEIPAESISSIPSLVFSISCFFNEDMSQMVTDLVEKLSRIYSKGMMIMSV